MISTQATGTQTATVGAAHTLAAIPGPNTLVLQVDLSSMEAGDSLELRVSIKATSSSSERLAYSESFHGEQGTPIFVSIPVPVAFSASFVLEQGTGSSRSFPWSVISLD